MSKILLTPCESAIRAAEKQVCALQVLYAEDSLVETIGLDHDYVTRRERSLQRLLRDALAQSGMLPGAANLESAEAGFLVERLRGFLKNEPCEVPICEESKLVQRCNDIAAHDRALSERIAREVQLAREAITWLQQSRTPGA